MSGPCEDGNESLSSKNSGYFLIRKTVDILLGTVPPEVTKFITVIFCSK